MNIYKLGVIAVCGAGLGGLGIVMAQQAPDRPQPPGGVQPAQPAQPSQPVQPGQPIPPAQRGHWTVNDHTLASCLATDNQEEVAMGKFAQGKTRNQEVKDFAMMIVKDHEAFLKKLERFAPEATRDGYLNENEATAQGQPRSTQPREGFDANLPVAENEKPALKDPQPAPAARANGPAHPQAQPATFAQLRKEVAEECLRESQQKLNKKSGAEFDKDFMSQQIGHHANIRDKLVVYQRHATPELRAVLAAGMETTDKHLQQAESIMKRLSGTSLTDAKQRSTTTLE